MQHFFTQGTLFTMERNRWTRKWTVTLGDRVLSDTLPTAEACYDFCRSFDITRSI